MTDVIHGYHYDKSDSHNVANGTWYKAESNDQKFFLKKFQNPKYPREGISPECYASKKKECDEWLAAKRKLISALDELGNGTGNIISPRDVFREKMSFYQTTYWIDVQTDSLDIVKTYSYDNKIMLLKTCAAALKKVHSKDIIHGDLKPDNILIGKSAAGKPAAKLIDFDDSYFSKEALPPEFTTVTDAYMSPELAAYKRGNLEYRERLTCSSDVFAMGIIFHQFWTGEMPEYVGSGEGKFIYEAVAAGYTCTLDPNLPEWLQNLINAMMMPFPEDRPTMEDVHIAVTNQAFDAPKTQPAPAPKAEPAPVVRADFSKLNQVWAHIPSDISGFTGESVTALKKAVVAVKRYCTGANSDTVDQATVNKCTKLLYGAIKGLEEKPAPVLTVSQADYSKIDKILSVVPSDLTDYTPESVATLRKTIRAVEANRNLSNQADVDKLTKILYLAYKGLKPAEQGEFSIRPADVLPAGYSKVKILSEEKVCVYTTSGSKMTIPRVTAESMKFVVPK